MNYSLSVISDSGKKYRYFQVNKDFILWRMNDFGEISHTDAENLYKSKKVQAIVKKSPVNVFVAAALGYFATLEIIRLIPDVKIPENVDAFNKGDLTAIPIVTKEDLLKKYPSSKIPFIEEQHYRVSIPVRKDTPNSYSNGRKQIDEFIAFANTALKGEAKEQALKTAAELEKTLIRGWTEISEAALYLGRVQAYLLRWAGTFSSGG